MYANIDGSSKIIFEKIYKWAKYTYTMQTDDTFKIGITEKEEVWTNNYNTDDNNLTDAVTASGTIYVGTSYSFNSTTETLSLNGTIKELYHYAYSFKFDGKTYNYNVDNISGYYILTNGKQSLKYEHTSSDLISISSGYDVSHALGFRLTRLYAGNDYEVECDRVLNTYGIFKWVCTSTTYETSTNSNLYYIQDSSIHGQDIYKPYPLGIHTKTYYNIVN